MDKQTDVMAILKLYELRRDEKMRAARAWFFSDFAPQTAMDIIKLYRDGEPASANFRAVTSYWDMASSFVLNGAIDEKIFLDANTEHISSMPKSRLFWRKFGSFLTNPNILFIWSRWF